MMIRIKINDTWTLTRISSTEESGALRLSFRRSGYADVARTLQESDQALLLRIFSEKNIIVNRECLRAYTDLRKLGLALPRPDKNGKMELTPAGCRVAIWIEARKTRKHRHKS